MAPVLQCPDCGRRHPLSQVPNEGTFPCRGCGRTLKVPEFVARTATSSAPVAAPAAPPLVEPAPEPEPAPAPAPAPTAAAAATAAATAATPPVGAGAEPTRAWRRIEAPDDPPAPAWLKPPPAPPAPGPGARRPVVIWLRLLLWIVAVPVAYVVVFSLARGLGYFTSTQLSDVFLANGFSRFWPVARLLPFVALLTALIVHGGVLVLGRPRRIKH